MKFAGIEEGGFHRWFRRLKERTPLVAVLFENLSLRDLRIGDVEVDGLDATEKALQLLSEWERECILLGSVAYAGFNFIDPRELHRELKVPVIVALRRKPNPSSVEEALRKHFSDWNVRWEVFSRFSAPVEVKVKREEKPLYVFNLGVDHERAVDILRKLTVFGRIPEPLRAARIIARGLSSLKLHENWLERS